MLAVRTAQLIVGHAKVAGREQVLVILVVLERAGLADQRVDYVTVIDRVLAAARQTRHPLHKDLSVPDFEVVGVDRDIHPIVDQPAGHRIRVALDLNRAAGADLDAANPPAVIELAGRQRAEAGLFLAELVGPRGVPLVRQSAEECFIVVAVGEVAAAAQQERLIDDGLQVTVRRLDVAVLMRLAGVGPLRLDLVVGHQVAVACAKLAIFREVVHRRAEAVATVPSRHAAQSPQRFLESSAERLERFREADRDRLPIRVGEREVIQQVVQRLAGDGDAQRIHVREVRCCQIAGVVDLREHDRTPRSMHAAPLAHPPFKRPPLRIGELAGISVLEPREEGERPQSRLGVQAGRDLRPDLDEGIHASPPGPLRRPLRREPFSVAILARRLLVHARPPRRQRQAIATR